ncbi:MAG: PAS domain-containing protein [Gemmatimonadaceae bacterium]|nr:PAS domain-containing protein [Chitinophagaceae bacterium]
MQLADGEIIPGETLDFILNQSHTPLAILTGPEFVFSFANSVYINLMNGRQLVGKTLIEAIPEISGQPFYQYISSVYETGIPYHGTEVPATAYFNGEQKLSTRYFTLSYTAYRNEKHEIEGVIASGFDVTDQVIRKTVEKESKIQKHAYKLFMDAPIGICILTGPEFTIELANNPVLAIWAKSSDVIGKPVLEALPEIAGQDFIEMLQTVVKSGRPLHLYEYPTTIVSGNLSKKVFLSFVYQPYYDDAGNPIGVIAIASDVTKQVLARQEVSYAEDTASLAIESAELGSYEIDMVNGKMTGTKRLYKIFGFTDWVPRETLAAVIHPEDLPIRNLANEIAILNGKLFYEARLVHSDDSLHWVRVTGRVYFDENNKPVRLIGIVQDVTEQKTFAAELFKQVEQRTREIKNTNKMLQKSNAELQEFAYVASHDLQEPVRKIRMFSHLMLDRTPIGTEEKRYAQKIVSSAERMAGLISDILEYSQLSQESSAFTTVDLNQTIKNILDDFELLIEQTKAEVLVDKLENIPAIPLQMNQLFYNLIGNSLKFAHEELPLQINISGRRLSHEETIAIPGLAYERNYYEITVSDNGIGFDQIYAEKIFTVFQRLNERNLYSGYGIGLALCNKIVTNHGGTISARSKLGKGAEFTVILPTETK